MSTLQIIPMDKLVRSRSALRPVRRTVVEFRELVDSIRKDGVLQPVLVRPVEDGLFEIVEGNHRYFAGKEVGLTELPCLVKVMTDHEVLVFQVKTQAMRPRTDRVDYARRLVKLMEDGMTINALAVLVGKSTGWVRGQLRLIKLIPEAHDPLRRGEIPIESAVSMSRVPQHLQLPLLQDAIELSSKEFCKKANEVRIEYSNFLLTGKQANLGEPHPYLRSFQELCEEAESFVCAGLHINIEGATSALGGWKACLKWMLHLDTVTLKNRREGVSHARQLRLSEHEQRKRNRKLTNDLLHPGDSQ